MMEIDEKKLICIPASSFKLNGAINIDLYIKSNRGLVLFKKRGLPLTERVLINLKNSGHSEFYISKDDIKEVLKDIASEVNTLLENESPSLNLLKNVFTKVQDIFNRVLENPSKELIDISNNITSSISEYMENNPDLSYIIYSLLKKDFSTMGHVSNVFALVSGFANHLGYKGDKLKTLIGGAFFHDIGKVKIPEEILKKPEKLTLNEFNIIKRHTVFGYEILKGCNYEEYAKIALSHHKFLDDSGYPEGVFYNKLTDNAKIVQICDIYEALVGVRPYKPSYEPYNAMEIIRDEFVILGKIDQELYFDFMSFLHKSKRLE